MINYSHRNNEDKDADRDFVLRTLNLMKPSILNSISSGAYLSDLHSDLHSELAKRLDLKNKIWYSRPYSRVTREKVLSS